MLERDDLTAALKNMSLADKKKLAAEIRGVLIDTVPKTGGHLASNLGVVELTLGMYSVLDPHVDRIVWDVGHQSYVHKLLTGRASRFGTLRHEGGISGFPVYEESTADCFDTGHSSTSVSAAIGLARARDIQGQHHHVAAVIGDGAFGSGMAFEALNDAGRIFNDVIIILNDNGMSISPNVGAMSKYLGRIRSRRGYVRIKKSIKTVLQKIPRIGNSLVRGIQRFKASVRLFIIPGELFEELGCKYIGPIDGHDIEAVQKAIEKAEYMGGPVLIQVITKKGKGYAPAEEDPAAYHGLRASEPDSATAGSSDAIETSDTTETIVTPPVPRSYSANFGNILISLADEHKDVTTVSAAMINGTGLKEYTHKYPDRYFDVGIAEQHAITMAAGMARGGLRPFVAMYSTFLQRAYDQVLHDCALQRLPVVIVLDRAGVSGADGKTHQGVYDMAMLNPMPDIVACAPCCIEEQSMMLRLAYDTDRPFVIRYPAADNSTFDKDCIINEPVAVGRGVRMLNEDAPDVLFITLGQITQQAIEAAEILQREGLRCEVFHARFLRPLDKAGILQFFTDEHMPRVTVTMEDGVTVGGFGSSVIDIINRYPVNVPSLILGFPTEPIPHATIPQLYHRYGLDGRSVAQRVIEELSE